jgi:hypothetical protein
MSSYFSDAFQPLMERDQADATSADPQRHLLVRRSPDDTPQFMAQPIRLPALTRLFSGRPHKDYRRHKAELAFIFDHIFPNWKSYSYQFEILPVANIPESTIYRWRAKWYDNRRWRPWNTQENYGRCNRQFTDQEEAEITNKIISEYIAAGNLFTCETFRALVTQYWEDLGRDPTIFKCSSQFICKFK